jgi:hypothetical protein
VSTPSGAPGSAGVPPAVESRASATGGRDARAPRL